MEYNKEPITIEQQIEILKQRGLIIDDEADTEDVLKRISYFRLACHWRPMEKDKVLHIFKLDSHFRNVITLYQFDSELK